MAIVWDDEVQSTPSGIVWDDEVAVTPQQPQPQAPAPSFYDQLRDSLMGGAETVATMGSGIVAEPIAGISGIAQTLNPFAAPGAGARAVEGTREALRYTPQTEAGQSYTQAVGEVLAPVGEAISGAENWLGDTTYEATGSPALAAAAKATPTLILELLGLASAKYANRASKTAKQADALMGQAAPTAERLKDVSRAVYKEIDDMGARVKPEAYSTLSQRIARDTAKMGLDPDITPAASKAVRRFTELEGAEVTLSELDTLRKVAQGAADSLNKTEKMLGTMIIDHVDDFLDTAGPTALTATTDGASIGKRYKVARELWGRARKSELLEGAIKDADLQASGLENGIRIQFRQILKNKKQRKFFKPDEIAEMEKVVKGTIPANTAKLLGRFGFSEGNATNILGGSIGAGAGATIGNAIAGPVGAGIGAAVTTGAGQLSRKLAQRITMGNAKFADELTRAGSSGRAITKAYLANTPKAERSVSVLSELLANPDIALDLIGTDGIVGEALKLAQQRRALEAAAVAGASNEGVLQRGNN